MQLCILGGMAEKHCSVGRQPDTSSFLALARHMPVMAKVHKGEWGNVITPHCVSVWERKLSNHPYREFAKYVMVSERGLEWVLIIEEVDADGNMKSFADHREVVESYIGREKEAGRLLGPFQ